MQQLNKALPKDFMGKVASYQEEIYYSNRGKSIQKASGIELTPEQVTYIRAVMLVCDRDMIDPGMGFVEIPVNLLFALMTHYSTKNYCHNVSREYMAKVTERCIDRLSDIVIASSYSEGKCRKFAIDKQFISSYYSAQKELLMTINTFETNNNLIDLKYCMNKSPNGEGFEHLERLNPYTVTTLHKVQNSRFRFDADFFHSAEGKAFIRRQELTNAQVDSLNCALEFINQYKNEPQYHGSFHLQQSGRMHTVGGCIQMPKWFRDAFILPVNPNNVRVEIDLKCAQLLILCDLLNASSLLDTILGILDSEGSIWPCIGNPLLDKRIKKVIVYAFCYGGELKSLPFLASQEARRRGLPSKITKQHVDECLNGLLAPLVQAREEWLQEYTIEKIIKSRGEKKPKNELDYPFPLYQTAAEIGKTLTEAKLKSTKVGSQLLAHLAQGYEQLVIQRMISEEIEQNILTFQYDGLTLEVPPDKVKQVIARLTNATVLPLDFTLPKQPDKQAVTPGGQPVVNQP